MRCEARVAMSGFIVLLGATTHAETSVPPLSQPVRVSESAAVIMQDKWPSPDANVAFEMVRLVNGSEVAMAVQDNGTQWRITLPTLPGPGERLRFRYTYVVRLNDDKKKTLKEKIDAFVLETASIVAEAYVRSRTVEDPQPKLGESMERLLERNPGLDQIFVGGDGAVPLRTRVLERLGFERDEKKRWTLAGAGRLNEAWSNLERSDLSAAITAQNGLSQSSTVGVAKDCTDAVEKAKPRDQQAPPPAPINRVLTACLDSLAKTGTAARALLPSAASVLQGDALDPKMAYSKTRLGRALESVATKSISRRRDFAAAVWAARERHAYLVQEVWMKSFQEVRMKSFQLDELVEKLESETLAGTANLEDKQDRRRWEFTTGVLYSFELDDVVAPLIASVCPCGCLRADEPYPGKENFCRTVGLDFGIVAATLDARDPRSGELAFVLGASWNPLSVLRVSGGAHLYENRLTQQWGASPYLGLTADLLAAAAILAPLGIKLPALTMTTDDRDKEN